MALNGKAGDETVWNGTTSTGRAGRGLAWFAALWVAVLVALLTAWDVWGRHEAFTGAKLLLRTVVFGIAAGLLCLLLRRAQGRRQVQGRRQQSRREAQGRRG